jgi:hypothetical protein
MDCIAPAHTHVCCLITDADLVSPHPDRQPKKCIKPSPAGSHNIKGDRGRLLEEASEDSMADFCIAVIQGAMIMGRVRPRGPPVQSR